MRYTDDLMKIRDDNKIEFSRKYIMTAPSTRVVFLDEDGNEIASRKVLKNGESIQIVECEKNADGLGESV